MATPNYSEEEIQFRKRARRRLVGAIVLVALVVAVVPLILPESKPQQETQQIDIRIPAQDATGYAPKITPAPATPALTPTPPTGDTSTSGPNAAPSSAAPVPAAPTPAAPENVPEGAAKTGAVTPEEVKPATSKPTAPMPPPSEIPLESPSPTSSQEPGVKATPDSAKAATFYVQYGAFSELKNAKQRQSELKAKGVPTFTEVVKTSNGDKIRVRSGPYATRDKAEKVREKAKPLDGKLVVLGQ